MNAQTTRIITEKLIETGKAFEIKRSGGRDSYSFTIIIKNSFVTEFLIWLLANVNDRPTDNVTIQISDDYQGMAIH